MCVTDTTVAGSECATERLAAVSIQCSCCVLSLLPYLSRNSTCRHRFGFTLLLFIIYFNALKIYHRKNGTPFFWSPVKYREMMRPHGEIR